MTGMCEYGYIRETLGRAELLAQLAEEATELAQAALKLRRAITEDNPTPKTPDEAIENLREEIADVDLCIVMVGDLCEDTDTTLERMDRKLDRWARRLRDAKHAEDCNHD